MNTVIATLAAGFLSMIVLACATRENGPGNAIPQKDITTVMNEHVDSLMAVPGVVGVYIGERPDRTPVIRVMVKEKSEALARSIPSELQGHPVEIEETGEIEPMNR